MASAPRRPTALDVFLAFLVVYAATAARAVPWSDAKPMWEAARSLVLEGSFAIDTRWPHDAPFGPDGRLYPLAPLLACLVHVPGALVHVAAERLAPDRAFTVLPLAAQIAPTVLGALTVALAFRILLQQGATARTAVLGSLLVGLGSSIFVYAHRSYSEIGQAACFTGFVGALLRGAEEPTPAAGRRLGLWAAVLINAKSVFLLSLPGAVALLLFRHRTRRGESIRLLAWAALGLLPGLIAAGVYNHLRWGSPFLTGYEANFERDHFRENVLVGLWGLFLSPGKSVFLYSPVLLLSLPGATWLARARSLLPAALAVTTGPVVLLYARFLFWHGDWAWGPRYLVFALPAWCLPGILWLGQWTPQPDRLRRGLRTGALGGLFAAALGVQVLGAAFVWDDFIDVARQVKTAWLGRADLRGAAVANDDCGACFEELHPIDWLPPMQPIAGHAWLLKHKLLRHNWRVARLDGPWRRYTSLDLDIASAYEKARLDPWWLARGNAAAAGVAWLLAALALLRLWLQASRSGSR